MTVTRMVMRFGPPPKRRRRLGDKKVIKGVLHVCVMCPEIGQPGQRGTRVDSRGQPYLMWVPVEAPEAPFRSLWESINGAGAWDANPWVWRVAFERVTP